MPGVTYEKTPTDVPSIIGEYVPERNNIKQKGRLHHTMPYQISAIFAYYESIEEITEENKEMVREIIHNFEERLVSVNGASREEYKDILVAAVQRTEQGKVGGISGYFSPLD